MNVKLKPCPFCGSIGHAHKMPKIDSYRAYCSNEDCWFSTKAEAEKKLKEKMLNERMC